MSVKTKMFSRKDAEIISHLRNNARKRITLISRQTKMPVTTIYDRVRAHEKKFIKKHTTLLDFKALGLNAEAYILIEAERESLDALNKFLMGCLNVNSLYRVNFGSDFLAEVVFKNTSEIEKFVHDMEQNYRTTRIQVLNNVEELKKECFLTKPEHFEVLI